MSRPGFRLTPAQVRAIETLRKAGARGLSIYNSAIRSDVVSKLVKMGLVEERHEESGKCHYCGGSGTAISRYNRLTSKGEALNFLTTERAE